MGRIISKILKVIVIVAFGVFAMGFITMWLWNALIPPLFHGPTLDFWQTVGILLLAKILFKGGGGHGWARHNRRRRWAKGGGGRNAGMWDFLMWDKYAQMTPEEREKMKEDWKAMGASREQCGPGMWGDNPMWQKMASMSPEERRKAKEEWKAQFKGWGRH